MIKLWFSAACLVCGEGLWFLTWRRLMLVVEHVDLDPVNASYSGHVRHIPTTASSIPYDNKKTLCFKGFHTGAGGFEPPSADPKSDVLPLHHAPLKNSIVA